MLLRRISVLVVALVACGDDGNNRRLADAPELADTLLDMIDDAPIVPPDDLELVVAPGGNGSGRITSSPVGIDCGAECTGSFVEGTMVTLTAEPDASSLFTSWGGACSGTSPVCEVTIDAATNVTATFTLKTYTVMVTKAGLGSGTVAGNGINCGGTCSVTVNHGTAISLTATPVALNNFVGWGGACSGTATCDLTITDDTTINAAFALDDLSLIVSPGGNGTGTITSVPAGINCGTDCNEVYTANQMITLTATPAGSSTFSGWSGACTGMGACVVTMDAAKAVTGSFTLKQYALDVTKLTGTGTGTVTSNPAGIGCGGDCTETYDHGTVIALTAAASPTSTFTGWSGGTCTGTAGCSVTLTAATTINAQFTIKSYPLDVTVTGLGTVTAPGINCSSGVCAQSYTHGTVVALTQVANPGYTFMGWGGACSGTGACSVTMDMMRSVTATFTINSYALTVTTTGTGTVSGNQISCPTDCTGTFTHGTVVALTQMAGPGYTFMAWGGACSGNGLCNVTMDDIKNVSATFTINSYALTVGPAAGNTGTGTITATNISCPGDCTENFTHNTVVTVSQLADGNSTFGGWGGACTGMGTCSVTMDAIKNVTAIFTIKSWNLDVTSPTGGTITAAQINCPGDCLGTFTHGTVVTVSHMASSGFQFTGWGGGTCMGTGACMVTMDMARTVSATFTPVYTLTVATNGGNGTGNVVSTSPAGAINCGTLGTNCTEAALAGASYTLTATPTTPGSTFTGWSGGGCSTTNPCTTTPIANTTVTATFTKTKHALTVNVSGNGQVDSTPVGINVCTPAGGANCTANYDYGTLVTLVPKQTGALSTASVFNGWGGACSGTGSCVVTMTAATTVTASFKIAPNVMFTTSTSYTGGLPNIQNTCDTLAATGNLSGDGPGQNKNWISMISFSAANDFNALLVAAGNPTGWARPDGKPVFNTMADVAANRVFYPPRLDEKSNDLGEAPHVWTGTAPNGTHNSHCLSSPAGTAQFPWAGSFGSAFFGLASSSSGMLATFIPGDLQGVQSCAVPAHLYCMGIDRKATVDEAKTPGRIAFTSAGAINPGGTLAAADNRCKTEATAAGLPGSYKAFLPGPDPVSGGIKSAIGRFDTSGPTWVRAGDQIPIVARASDLSNDQTKFLLTAPNANADGTRVGINANGQVTEHWSGSTTPMALGSGVNCGDWMSNQGKGKSGYAGDTSYSIWWDLPAFSGQSCTVDTRPILCFQE